MTHLIPPCRVRLRADFKPLFEIDRKRRLTGSSAILSKNTECWLAGRDVLLPHDPTHPELTQVHVSVLQTESHAWYVAPSDQLAFVLESI